MIKKVFMAVCMMMSIVSMNVYAGDFEKSVVEIKEKIQQPAGTFKMKIVKRKNTKQSTWNADYGFSISSTHEYIAIFTVVDPCHSVLSVTDITGKNRRLCLYQGDEAAPNDVESSRIVWHTKKNILYFAGSPIYGKSGIYKWNIEKNTIEQIVKPKNITKAFPDGYDFFILLAISPDNKYLYYYHSPTKQTVDIQDIEHLYYIDLQNGKIYKVLNKK